MKKLLLLVLAGLLVGVVGCTGAGDKATDDKSGDTTKNGTADSGKKADAPYVGKYGVVLSDADKKSIESSMGNIPADKKAEAIKKMEEEAAKLEVVINADGTYEMNGAPGGNLKGTYTASGNTITFNPAEGSKDQKKQTATYNEADQTLTNPESKTVFKKK